jgi:hypothetical protein
MQGGGRMIPRISEEEIMEMILQSLKKLDEKKLLEVGYAVVSICNRDREACLAILKVAYFIASVVKNVLRGGEEKKGEE